MGLEDIFDEQAVKVVGGAPIDLMITSIGGAILEKRKSAGLRQGHID